MEMGPERGSPDEPADALPAAERYPGALCGRFEAYDEFLPDDEAEALRAPIDAHFSEPHQHRFDTHFVWNYWYVPGLYTYLRAAPENVIPQERVTAFHDAMTRWATETLGLAHVSWPILSLYVDGCGQGIHNDSANGRFGYVYSLTRERQGRGGETIVFKEGDPFRSRLRQADAGTGLYDLVAPIFNRLVLFDDRMPHGVQRVEGSMDPTDARIVLHGHISEAGPVLDGPLPARFVEAAREAALNAALAAFPETGPLHHGPLCVRLEIAPHGRVSDCRVLVHRVARSDGGDPDLLVDEIVDGLATSRFPAASAPTVAILPILTGGLLPLAAERMGVLRQAMLLAIDAGNTNLVFALVEDGIIRARWRIATDPRRTADQYAVWLHQLLALEGYTKADVSAVIIGTVVPRALHNLEVLASKYFGKEPLVAGQGAADWGIELDVAEPRSVGADRVLNVIAAHALHEGDLIVVDFGTATTFDLVDYSGAYKGGIIAPGINLSLDALVSAAAKLPRVAIEAPESMTVIGRTTEEQMHIGIYWGYVAMMEGLVQRLKAEIGRPATVIATGGLATLFDTHTDIFDAIEGDLTIQGLAMLYERSQSSN